VSMPLVPRKQVVPAVASNKEGKRRILYVEDDDLNFEVLELLLRKDFELVRASTAAQAMALLSYQSFDVLVLDIQLSGSHMNGVEIAQIVNGLYGKGPTTGSKARPKIIFLTASDIKEQAIPAAAQAAILRKPVDPPALLKALRADVLP
jgi:CheY-like chemotaxis protein